MTNNQILVLIIVIVVVIILVFLFWGWWASSTTTTTSDATYKDLLLLRNLMDDKRVFTREYSRNLTSGGSCLEPGSKVLEDTNLGIATVLAGRENTDTSKATGLSSLLNAQTLFLKRLHDGESETTVQADTDKNTAAILALLSNKACGDSQLKNALDNYNLHTVAQYKSLTSGDCAQSYKDYNAVKKDTADLYDLFYAYIIANRKGK